MDRTDSSAAMASLASYAESESDDEDKVAVQEPKTATVDSISDDEHDTPTPNPSQSSRPSSRPVLEDDNSRSGNESVEAKKPAKKKINRLVSYGADELDEEEEDEEEATSPPSDIVEHGTGYVEGKVMSSSLNVEQASSLSRAMLNKSFDEVELPPEPPNKCPKHLQEKIARLHERRRAEGLNLNDNIQMRVEFRNPSIYEKLIEFCQIDEKGTNYPPELFDPLIWGKESYYDALDKAQKSDMERREKERKERTKVEFVVGTKKSSSKTEISSSVSSGRPDEKKRKTKWDSESSQAQAGRIAESINKSFVPNLTTLATGTKSTIIPATGSIAKKPSK